MGDVADSVRAAAGQVSPEDVAVLQLALVYAAHIDREPRCSECGGAAWQDLTRLGPALLSALEALQLSPRARKQVKISDQPTTNPLDQLSARRAGKGRTSAVHPPAP